MLIYNIIKREEKKERKRAIKFTINIIVNDTNNTEQQKILYQYIHDLFSQGKCHTHAGNNIIFSISVPLSLSLSFLLVQLPSTYIHKFFFCLFRFSKKKGGKMESCLRVQTL